MADRTDAPADDRGSEPALDWLDEIAAAEGLSREAAIEYLVSSYWRLEEIVDLLEAGDGSLEARADDEPARDDLEGLHDRFDTLLSDLRRREDDAEERDAVLSSILELGDRLERLEDALSEREGHERLRDRLDDVEDATDRLAEEVRALGDDLSSATAGLEDLDSRLEELDAAAVDEERFEAFADRTASFQQELSGRHESLRSRVRTEFEHIRTVLVHLLEEPSAEEDGVRALRRELAELSADREALASLTRAANRLGARRAACAHCDEPVDIGLLRSPTCPVCEARFTDLETVSGFLGLRSSYRLQVEPGSAD